MLRAKAIFPGRGRVYCTIRNLSEGGALLSFEDGRLSVPYRFELEIEGFGVRVSCEPRHGGDEGTGVSFLSGDVKPILAQIDRAAARKRENGSDEPVAPEDLRPSADPSAGLLSAPSGARSGFDALGFRRARLATAD